MPLFVNARDSAGEILQANLGYYVVGDKFYYNTIDAYKQSNATGAPIHHSFYDDVFITAHKLGAWKNLTLPSLYSMRARQLREQYDVIAVNFSGGWDSRNILDTFEAENIHVDFIVIWSVKGAKPVAGDKSPGNWISEVADVAIPYAREFCLRHPRTKVIIVDEYTNKIIEEFGTRKDNTADIFSMSKQKPGVMYARNMEFQNNSDVQALLSNGKNACLITGTDKPIIRHMATKTIGIFPEAIHSKFKIPRRSLGYADNIVFESFYWTPFLPELAIRGWYELYKLSVNNKLVYAATDESVDVRKRSRLFRSLEAQHELKKMLYPQYDSSVWTVNKPRDCGFLVTVELPVVKVLDEFVPSWRGKLKEVIQGTVSEVGEQNIMSYDNPNQRWAFETSDELSAIFTSDFFVRIKPTAFFKHELDLEFARQFATQ